MGKSIEDLFQFYEQIMNSEIRLNNQAMIKITLFLDKVYNPIRSIDSNKVKQSFNNNYYFISLFKKLLNNLYNSAKVNNYYNQNMDGRDNDGKQGKQ